MKKRLMFIAHSIKAHYDSFSEALIQAWKIIKLQWALCLGVVTFSYTKKSDGSTRVATGTLCDVPKTAGRRPVNYGLLTYYDLDAQAWRSALNQNIIFN